MDKKEIKTYGELAEEYSNSIIKRDRTKKEELQRKYGMGLINKSIYLLAELKNKANEICRISDIGFVKYTKDSIPISDIYWRIEQINKLKAELDKDIV